MKKKTLIILIFAIINPLFAFKPSYHRSITQNALSQDGFDEQTINTVTWKNTDVDILHPALSEAHGDNNELENTSRRIRDFRDEIVDDLPLRDCKRGQAVLKFMPQGCCIRAYKDVFTMCLRDESAIIF